MSHSLRLEVASEGEAQRALPDLISLLINAVDAGASIGFLPPLAADVAEAYWRSRLHPIAEGECVLFLAWVDGTLAGSAQLSLVQWPNAPHRADVNKVMVHTAYRRQGLARQLMRELETHARRLNRTLLVLDTRRGDPSEIFYQQSGFLEAGSIPRYVLNPDGGFEATVFYYKILSPPDSPPG